MSGSQADLPDGWASVSLGDIADFEMGQAPPGTSCNKIGIGTVFVKAGEFGADYPLVREWTTQPLKFAKAGDVLICVVGATSGKLNLGIDCAIGRSVAAIQPSYAITQKALYRQLQLQVEQLRADSTGTAQGVISKQMLASIQVVVPPTHEQTRIADQLDTLLARIQSCNDRLNAIPGLLKRFRQAVLRAATAGHLTEEIRAQKQWPSNWTPQSLATLGELGRGKSKHRPRNDPRLYGGPFPFVQTGDVAQSRGVISQHRQTYSEFGLQQSRLWPAGTLCITIAANIADTAILAYPACFPDSVVGFVADTKKCLGEFVKWSIDVVKGDLEALAPATAQKNINLSVLNDVKIRCPSLDEQMEIVRRAKALLAIADRIEARHAAAIAQAQRLSLLTLAKAFRGELVPQDPNDESASALLARIAAQRSASAAVPKSRQPRRAATPRTPKEIAAMTKSRQDDDVMGYPYLADHLRRLGTPATAEALFRVAELPVADFYKQLAWEVTQGHVKDNQTSLEPVHAAG